MFGISILVALAAGASNAGQVDPDAVVRCVREPVTGSLMSTRRVCHTVGEWRRIRNDSSEEVRRNMQPGTMNDQNG